MIRTAGHLAAVLAALIVVLLPFGAYFADPGVIYNALAADTYYYAALARNFVEHGFFGIDGRTVSNGYMPLWQMGVAVLDGTLAGPGAPPGRLLFLVFATSLGLIAFGVAGLVLFVSRRFGPGYALLSLPLLCPGAAFFLLEHTYPEYLPNGIHAGHSMWTYANGMESGIGLALFALFLPLATRSLDPTSATRRVAFLAGAVAFLIMMARLDDVFLGIAFGLCLLPVALRQSNPRLLVTMAIVPLAGTAAYLAVNTATVGAALPSSGMLKTQIFGFPNGWHEIASIGSLQRLNARMLPLMAFLIIGAIGLLSQLRNRGEHSPLIVMLSLYLLMKAGFLFSSVPAHEQGFWYYTNMLAAMNLLIVIALAHVLSLTPRALAIALPVSLAAIIVAAVNISAQLKRFPKDSYTTVARQLCTFPESIAALLPGGGIIDTGDGVYAFCLGRPAVTLTGLADSREFNALRNEKGFYPAALEQGFSIIVASPVASASYDWRGFLAENNLDAVQLLNTDHVTVWQIER